MKLATDIGGTFTDLVYLDEATGEYFLAKSLFHTTALFPGHHGCHLTNPGSTRPGYRIRPRRDGGHQCADRAQGSQNRAGHHCWLPRCAGDRPRQSSRYLQHALSQATALRPARAAFRSGRAHELQGRGRDRARSGTVDAVARQIGAEGCDAVAVCLLHSYANPEHERRSPIGCASCCRTCWSPPRRKSPASGASTSAPAPRCSTPMSSRLPPPICDNSKRA